MATVSYGDFASMDLRVVKIVSAEPIPGRDRIMRGVIDTGTERVDVIIGGAQYQAPDEMVGRTAIAIVNLEPKRLAGVESGAMLLAADVDGRPFWLGVDGGVPPGSPVK